MSKDKMLRFVNQKLSALFLCVFCMMLFCINTAVAAVNVKDLRIGNQTDGVRVVFDMDKSVKYRVFSLDGPKRIVIDLDDANLTNALAGSKNQLVEKTRIGKLDGNNKRVVLDLKRAAVVKKAFLLNPQSGMPWRFVVDLSFAGDKEFTSKSGPKHSITNDSKFSPKEQEESSGSWFSFSKSGESTNMSIRKKIIVLDPGHGGKDPGAIGGSGTYEKNITLSMGKELQTILQKRGYTVYLTRNTDIFIPLRQRIKIAQKYKADLFMSIHADSAQNRQATGLSVYTLSDTASDKEAAALAERENKADIIGGVDLGGNSKEVNDILISLSQTDTRNKSSKYATYLVKEMAKCVKLVKNTHRFAGFAVLKAPDIPSSLLEMGYLSNRTEEANLRKPAYRLKLANAAANAIDQYFKDPEIASN
ncbi:MAG: N-acetylmuramoyl-L-alanine amidase [Alphaproteobacteria bacterium]|nr:N-acetylmuramoyl-L-alanine amidase [Alphaproteobacteria bacterium]